MAQDTPDYYELLQISPNAEPETIHRVYRLFAQRVHPDNTETGNLEKFRLLQEAYAVLSDPARRAQYDVAYHENRKDRWRVLLDFNREADDLGAEQLVRLTVLEVLYAKRRTEPANAGIYLMELEQLSGTPREHLEFTIWYLVQKRFIERGDSSQLMITVAGVDYLEEGHQATLQQKRLRAAKMI